MKLPLVIRLINAVCLLALLPVPCLALTPAQVFDKVKDAVVVVKTMDTQGKMKGQGSGVILSSGRVATNCHVVEGGASYRVGRGEKLLPATLYAEDSDKDICLLDAKGVQGKPAQLGRAIRLKVGDPVYAVGAPQGLELSLSDGIVAQLRGGPTPMIQTTAAISPGSSGGGLFDGEGHLVGLTTFYVEGGQSLNFAMPVEWIGEVKPGRTPAAQGSSHTEWLKRAIALEAGKDWKALLEWCRNWTAKESGNAYAWTYLGVAYDDLNRYNDAIEAYRQAIHINPEAADAWYFLGVAYYDLKRYNDAIEAYRQAMRINPEDADAWTSLGAAYDELKRYNDAIEAYRQSMRINPEDADVWYNLGNVYRQLKRYNDAIEAYRQAIRLNPEYAFAWHNLGIAYFFSGNRTAALDAVRELRRLDPAKADELFNLIVPR
jgi:tetratricopeptide (TPR) repeat protein